MKSNLFASVALVGLVVAAPQALAQNATAPAKVDGRAAEVQAPAADEAVLGEIVVTAQRRSENLQRAALAVSVVSSDALLRQNVTQSAQLTTLVPALQVAASGSTNLFYLRGVGTFAVNAFSDPAIAFNYDGVYIGRPSATTGVFYDLERVEVLKGPQGTLYGRNATGGAINIIPAKPILNGNTGNFSAAFGNYDAINLQGAVNVALSDIAAVRISGMYTKHDGYLSDGVNDEDGKGFRAQLLVKPTSNLSIRVGGDYYHAGGNAGGGALVGIRNPFTGAITASPFGRDVGLYDSRVQQIYPQQYSFQVGRTLNPLTKRSFMDSTYWGLNADISLATDFGTLTVVPAYRDVKFSTVNNITSFISNFNEGTKQTSLEARFASPDTGRIRYLLGGYYYDEKSNIADGFSQQTLSNFLNSKLSTTSLAAFGRLTFAVTDQFRLTGGLRYTSDRKSINGGANTLIDVCLAAACPGGVLLPYATGLGGVVSNLGLVGPFPSPNPAFNQVFVAPTSPSNIIGEKIALLNDTQNSAKLTWRAGVEYDVAPASLLYASYETGYRGGGFSLASDPSRQQYRPETIRAFTLGSKNRFLDNRLQINVEAFDWRYEDQQLAHLGVDSTGASAFFTENIGTSHNYGGEVEAQYKVTRNTLLSANVQYLNAKYTTFSYTTPSPPPTRCAVSPTGAIFTVDCSGLRALRSPEWTMNLGAQQTIPLGEYKIVVEGGARYQSSSYVGFELLDIERQAGYWTGQVSITVSPEDNRFSVSAFVNNIGNQRPLGDVLYDGSTNLFSASSGAPTHYGIRLSVNY